MLSSDLYPAYFASEKKLTAHVLPQFGRHCFRDACRGNNSFRALTVVLICSILTMIKTLSFRSSIRTILAESSLLQLCSGVVCATTVPKGSSANAKAAQYCLRGPKIFTRMVYETRGRLTECASPTASSRQMKYQPMSV